MNQSQASSQVPVAKETEPKKKKGGIVAGLKTLIPFRDYDLSNSQGRHDYVENFFFRFGRILSFVPFIIIMAVATTDPTAAIWSAFGINFFINMSSVYRHRYNPVIPFMFILDVGMGCAFLGEGIANQIIKGGLPAPFISAITTSALFVTALISHVVCYPFTIQFAKSRAPPEVVGTWSFVIFNHILTLIWTVIFAIMTVCAWVGHFIYGSNTSSAGYIMLSTVIPILLPMAGGALMSPVASCLQARARKGKEGKEGTPGHDDEDGDDEEKGDLLGDDVPAAKTMD